MKLGIRYQADFHYAEEASFSLHVARLFPRRDHGIEVRRTVFSSAPSADIQFRQDLFDNLVANCFFPEPLAHLPFVLELDLEVTERNPFHFLLAPHALELPFAYTGREAEVLAPAIQPRGAPFSLPTALTLPATPQPTVDVLVAMNSWVHENITYERREEGDPREPGETLNVGTASCRDFAVLFAEVLRHQGLAVRLASGFLWEDEVPAADRRAENALHAWLEIYLPGAGWVGFDPTNGVLCDHHAITTAIGLTPEDITPIEGRYFGKRHIASTLETSLRISELS
jgi:transglutaminase-like putative cysteine protease